MKFKKGMGPGAFLVGLAMVLLVVGGSFLIFGDDIKKLSIGDEDTDVDAACTSETTPSVNLRAYDFENKGTAITEAGIYRKDGTTSWTAFTPGTAIDNLEVNGEYEAVFGISTSDFVDNTYGPMIDFKVKCQEIEIIETPMYNDEVETSVSATFYNADNNQAAQSFSAGMTEVVSAKLVAGSDEYFGNPELPDDTPNVLCMNLNSTTWDKPEKVSVRGGAELKAVAQPTRHSSAAGKNTYCYEMPVLDDDYIYIDLKLNADDSNAPAADETLSLYAANWFVDKDAEIQFGVETDEGADVATDDPDELTLDFT